MPAFVVPYLPSALLIAAGLLLLGVVMISVLRALRRLAAARRLVRDTVVDRAGLLRARVAALDVAIAQRWPTRRPARSAPRSIAEQATQEAHP